MTDIRLATPLGPVKLRILSEELFVVDSLENIGFPMSFDNRYFGCMVNVHYKDNQCSIVSPISGEEHIFLYDIQTARNSFSPEEQTKIVNAILTIVQAWVKNNQQEIYDYIYEQLVNRWRKTLDEIRNKYGEIEELSERCKTEIGNAAAYYSVRFAEPQKE